MYEQWEIIECKDTTNKAPAPDYKDDKNYNIDFEENI